MQPSWHDIILSRLNLINSVRKHYDECLLAGWREHEAAIKALQLVTNEGWVDPKPWDGTPSDRLVVALRWVASDYLKESLIDALLKNGETKTMIRDSPLAARASSMVTMICDTETVDQKR